MPGKKRIDVGQVVADLNAALSKHGMKVYERDDGLAVFPIILQSGAYSKWYSVLIGPEDEPNPVDFKDCVSPEYRLQEE